MECHWAHNSLGSPAFQIYIVQTRLQLPGLVSECEPFLVKLGLTNLEAFSEIEWKKLINEKILEFNKKDLLHKMKTKKKMDEKTLEKEDFEIKTYFSDLNLEQARLKFQIRSSMVRTVKMNYPSELWKYCGNTQIVTLLIHKGT